MRKFLVGAVLVAGATFGLIKALDGLDNQMQADTGLLSTTTTMAASMPSDPAAAAPEAAQAAAPSAAAPAAQPAASRPRATTAAPTPTAAPTTSTTAKPVAAQPSTTQPSGPPACTLRLSTENPTDGQTVTVFITSNMPSKKWLGYPSSVSPDDRNQGGYTDSSGSAQFSFPARTGDNGNVMVMIGDNFVDVPEESIARCKAHYTVG